MNLFEEHNKIFRDFINVNNKISYLVNEWAKKNIGFADDDTPYNGHKGLTRSGEVGWNIIDDNQITISYAVYEDKYGDYWSDNKYITITYDELLKNVEE